MADNCCCRNNVHEIDDVHRLLPPEILKDIGITNADDQHLMVIVEELSSRLAAVLGAAMNNGSQHRHLSSPSCATTNPYQHHYYHHRSPQPPHYYYYRLVVDDGNANAARAEAWPWRPNNGGTLFGMDMAICQLPRQLAPPPPGPRQVLHGVPPPAANHGNRGTGVFLPRAQAYGGHNTAKAPRTTGGGADAKQQQCRQQQRRQLHFHGDDRVNAASRHGYRDELGSHRNGSIDRWIR